MMKRLLLAGCAVFVLAASKPVLAQDLLRLAPSSDWTVGRAGEFCLLTRSFGDGAGAVQLQLRSYEPEGRFHVMVTGELARPAPRARTIRIGFADVEHLDVPYLAGQTGGAPGFVLQPAFSLGPLAEEARRRMDARLPVSLYAEPEIEARIDTIAFEDGLVQEFVLETGSLGEPMEALRQCARELADGWAVTFAQRATLSRVAIPRDRMRWFASRAFRRHLAERSMHLLRLIVGEDGSVAECALTGAPSPEDAEAACALAREEARFDPALDAEGRPGKDYWVLTWQAL